KASSLENHPHKSNSIRYFLIIIVNSSVRLADLNYGLFFHLRGENAISYVEGKNKYYGTKVTINVWKPKIQQQYEFTFSQIWLLSDLFRKYLNIIEAGWQVHSVNF
uniref:Neprosin PEP catalytic domain-containing protein n=1 Tax=Brassica oleracea var. oleracea TaxID=109376 RepID=A0A0D3DKM7_BRAOL